MKSFVPIRSRSLLLPLMLVGSSFFWTAARSTSKKGLSLFVEATPKNTGLVSGYFGDRNRRPIAFATPRSVNRKRDATSPSAFTSAFTFTSTSTSLLSTTTTVATDDANNKGSSSNSNNNNNNNNNDRNDDHGSDDLQYSPWNDPKVAERAKKRKQGLRSHQHVNPLARKFQQPTILSDNWPVDVFEDLSKPIFLDIGCSRGGFLLDMATQRPDDYNYLGLEIRPIVVYHAQDRIPKRNLTGRLDFVGCNANVDLDRLLTLLTTTITNGGEEKARGNVEMVTIQFPDPHFKARHAKRRVVTPELVQTLARFMPEGATVYLQSDVQSVLDEMRLQFREESEYFRDTHESVEEYIPENILGVPTEREVSVLERDLPVYRAKFTRTDQTMV